MIFSWLLLLVTLALLFSRFSRTQSPFSPVRMYLYGWLLVLGTMASGMIHFNRPMALVTFLLMLATHLFFYAGAYLAGRPPGKVNDISETTAIHLVRDDFDRLTLLLIFSLAIVGIALTAYDLFFGHGRLLLDEFSSGLKSIRGARWQIFFSKATEVSPLRSLTTTSCMIAATLFPFARKYRHNFLLFVSSVSAAVLVIQSFLSAGRFLFGLLVLSIVVSTAFVYGGDLRRRLVTMPRFFVGGSIAFYFLIIFPTLRNPDLALVVERSIQWITDAELAGWVKRIGEHPEMAWIKILAYSSSYFSGSLDKLNYFVTETDVMSWYKLGLYNVTQISQLLGTVVDGITPWQQARMDIANLMRQEGWSLNPWATGVRDLGIDFGIVGATAVMGLLGYVCQKIFILSQTRGSYLALLAATYVSVSCFIFAFISPFQIRIFGNSFWLLGIIALVRAILVNLHVRLPEDDTTHTKNTRR